jgi:Flp pilus assembly protein TadG
VRAFRKRHGADDGAAAVEFALLFPVFALFLFGMITSANAYANKQGIAQGVREGARYAATLPTPGTTAWLDSAFTVAHDSASTDLGNSADICVAYIPAGATVGNMRKQTSGGSPSNSTGTCIATDTRVDPRVQVVISRPFTFQRLVLPSYQITLQSQSVTRYERATS